MSVFTVSSFLVTGEEGREGGKNRKERGIKGAWSLPNEYWK
jgi:hypothetical protein